MGNLWERECAGLVVDCDFLEVLKGLCKVTLWGADSVLFCGSLLGALTMFCIVTPGGGESAVLWFSHGGCDSVAWLLLPCFTRRFPALSVSHNQI